jgi:hypothetical protein
MIQSTPEELTRESRVENSEGDVQALIHYPGSK